MTYSPPPTDPASWSASAGATSSEERNWAVTAHVGVFVAWFFALALLAPLIVLLVKGNASPFIRRHAVESLNFQITALIVGVVGTVLGFVTFGLTWLALLIYGIFYVIVVIVATVRASNGQDYRYPLTLRLVS